MENPNIVSKLTLVQPPVVLIGSGNVGTQIGRALQGNGFDVLQVISKDESHAKALAGQILTAKAQIENAKEGRAGYTTNFKELNKNAEWYIIAVNDDAIEEVANRFNVGDKIVCHTSGTVAMDVLKNASTHYGVFYPLQTFSKDRNVRWRGIPGTPICIEGNNAETEFFLERAAMDISGNVQKLNTEKRRWAHLAAVWGNNFTNFMLTEAETICNAHGIPFTILKPLLEETIAKAFENGPSQSQTGPAVRGDEHTIANHLKMLEGDKVMQEIYKRLSEGIGRKK